MGLYKYELVSIVYIVSIIQCLSFVMKALLEFDIVVTHVDMGLCKSKLVAIMY